MRHLPLILALTITGCASQPPRGVLRHTVAVVCPTLNTAVEITAALLSVPTGLDTTTADMVIGIWTLSPCYEIGNYD